MAAGGKVCWKQTWDARSRKRKKVVDDANCRLSIRHRAMAVRLASEAEMMMMGRGRAEKGSVLGGVVMAADAHEM